MLSSKGGGRISDVAVYLWLQMTKGGIRDGEHQHEIGARVAARLDVTGSDWA